MGFFKGINPRMDLLFKLRQSGQSPPISRIFDFLSDSDVDSIRRSGPECKDLVEQWVLPTWKKKRLGR